MPIPTDQRRKRKIRCPKCTALLTEPPFDVFECPICATLLRAKGARSSEVSENGKFAENIQDGSLKQVKENSNVEQRKQEQVIENERRCYETQPIDDSKNEITSSDGNGTIHNTSAEVNKDDIVSGDKSALPQDLEAEIPSDETVSINNPITKVGENAIENDQEAKPLVDQKNKGENSLSDKQSDNNHAFIDENVNGWNLEAKNFRDVGHELSFKYSLEGKDDHLFHKRQRNLRSDSVKADVLSSPLNSSLRVRLALCSGPTEDESCYSSVLDSESHNDGSESSEFDFPAPSQEHMQVLNLPTPFIKKKESFRTNSGPHLLEFRDPYCDTNYRNDEDSSQDNSMKKRLNQELVRKQTNGGTDNSENEQDSLQGAISGVRKLEIGKELSEMTICGSITIDSTVVRSDDGARDVAECNERISVNGSSQQLPGTIKIGEGKEINTLDMKSKPESDAGMGETKVCVQKTEGLSDNLHCTASSNVWQTQSSDGPNQEIPNSSLSKHGTNFLMKVLSSLSDSKERPIIFHNNDANILQLRPHQEVRNLPGKLLLFDSEGRLIYQEEKQENKNMNQLGRDLNRLIATEDRYLQPVSAVEDWDLYNSVSPNHSVEGDLYEPSPVGFPCNPLSNQMDLTISRSRGCGYSNHEHVPETYSTGASSENRTYPYQVSSKSAMLTRPISKQTYTHCGYHHHVSMNCIRNQHAHMLPTQMPQHTPGYSQPITLMMHQTGPGEWLNYNNQDHGQSSYPFKEPQSYDALNLKELNSPTSSSGRKYKHYPLLPTGGAPPYIICKSCISILAVPHYLPLKGVKLQKIRCGSCDKVSKFSTDYENKRPLLYGVTNTQPLVHSNQQSRLLAVSNDTHLMDSFNEKFVSTSHDQDVSKRLSAAVSNARSILQESQGGGESSTSHTTHSDTDTSPRYGRKTSQVVSTVDEKEEGLDYGAPRISDGDSLESRTRSPENQGNLGDVKLKNDELAGNTEIQESAQHVVTQRKKEGSPLLVLLNQGSKKFSIDLETIPYEETKASLVSTISNNQSAHCMRREIEARVRGQSSLSRGPKYIAGLLRRSLRDIAKAQ